MSVDSPIQVDIDQLDADQMQTLKSIYEVMSAFLEDTKTIDNIDDAEEVLGMFTQTQIRDGVLKYFTILPKDMRLDVLRNATLYIDFVANNSVDMELVVKSTAYLAALMALHAAFKLELDEDITEELEIISGLFDDVERLGEAPSLMRLLQVAINHGVPLTVFKDSVDCLTLEECVKGAQD